MQLLQRPGHPLLGRIPLEVQVEEVLERHSGDGTAFQFQQVDPVLVQDAQRLQERSLLVRGGHDQGCLAGDAPVHLRRLPGQDQEAGEVVRLVLDVALQDLQPVEPARFLAADGRDRWVPVFAHFPNRHGGVGPGDRLAVGEPGDELHALGQGLGVRVDPADPGELGLRQAQQAVFDPQHLLPHDGELGNRQEIVHLVDAPRRGVLDRDEGVVGVPVLHRADHLPQPGDPLKEGPVEVRGEVFARRQVAVGALDPLEHHPLQVRLRVALQVQLLGPDRIVDDLLEDPGDEVGVEPAAAPLGDEVGEQHLLARRVADGRPAPVLGLDDPPGKGPPCRKRFENGLVHPVDFASNLFQFLHTPSPVRSFFHCCTAGGICNSGICRTGRISARFRVRIPRSGSRRGGSPPSRGRASDWSHPPAPSTIQGSGNREIFPLPSRRDTTT